MFTGPSFPAGQSEASEDDTVPNEPEGKALLASCLYTRLYNTFCTVLIALDGNPMASGTTALEVAHEECTRLKIWGVQSRVSMFEAHGLLELEEQSEIGQLLIEVLSEANDTLRSILLRAPICDAAPLEFEDGSDSDSADSSSGSENSTSINVAKLLQMVFENIDELYRLKSLLQKPRLRGRYLHSSRPQYNLPGYQQDYQHVRQKLDSWKTESTKEPDEEAEAEESEANCITDEFHDEPSISMDEITKRNDAENIFLEEIDVLCRRLAAANSKRRKQLRYWDAHPYRYTQVDERILPQNMDVTGPIRQNDALNQSPPGLKGTAAISVKAPTTVHTFSTAPRSAIFPVVLGHEGPDETRTTYEPSAIGSNPLSAIRVPDAPEASEGEATVECPYCHMPLKAVDMAKRVNWKRHVFRDLRPYVCTVAGCSDPDRQFATRYDWTYHEMQAHHRRWDCSECEQDFETRHSFCVHMSEAHGGSWNERQISILGDLRERAKDDRESISCRLCSANLQKRSYFKHVANHLEELSLFALPEATLEENGEAKTDVARPDTIESMRELAVKFWDAHTGTCEATLEGHTSDIDSAAFLADGRRIVSASHDKTVKLWDAATGACEAVLKGHTSIVTSAAFSADGRHVVSTSRDKTVKLWDATTGVCEATLEGHTSVVTSAAFSVDGRRVVSASYDKTVKVWDAATGACEATLEGHTSIVTSAAFSVDGRRVVSASDDRTVKVWNV